ncbi:hypothetical protein ACP70R_002583 [Stipagrostis hirtigluma subsp. patula]
MDPDQVPAAGVHHDGLDEASAPAGGGDGDEGWARTLLRRGWDLSRKAAIAGAAATAAPVVAPPILILSVAGVALSVPFAACLASLAATDRLMAALLPPCRPTEPYHAYDQEDDEWEEQEFLDAAEAPDDEAPALHYDWSKTEDAVEDEDESAPLLPLSREPCVSEEPPPVPMSAGEEGVMAEGDLAGQESGHEPFVADIGEQEEHTTTVDNEFITMETLPQGSEFPGLTAPALYDDDSKVQRMVEAAIGAQQSVPEPSVSDSGDQAEDVKCKTIEEDESTMEMQSLGLDVSEVLVPMLGDEDIVPQHEEEDDFIKKSGHDSLVSSSEDRAEDRKMMEDKNTEMPPQDIDVSESMAPDDRAVHRKTEGEVTVEMVPKEVTSRTDPVTGDVVDVRMDVIAITQPESEQLPPNDLVVCKLQAITEAAYDENARRRTVTEDIVRDLGYTNTEGLEHGGEGPAASVVKVHDGENVKSSTSTTTAYVPAINDGMMSVESRPAVNLHHQITDVENMRTKDGFGKKPVSEDRYVKTEERKTMDDNMALQELAVSGSPIVQDNAVQRKRDDELTVEVVVEEVASITAPVTDEVVDVKMDVTTTGSASRPHGNLAAHVPTEAATVDDTQGSTLIENIVTNTSDPNTLEGVEHHGEEGVCSSVLKTCVVSLDDGGDLMSSESTTFVSAIRDDVTVESRPDVDHPHQTAGVQYPEMNERFGKVGSEDEDIYTEERLREELDIIRTITGYRAVPSSTLEGELTGLYTFVGVEPPVSTKDVPDLMELSAKLRFLKSIIGVE